MKNNALILDTETTDLDGYPIQISYMPCELSQGNLCLDSLAIFDEYFSTDSKISIAAMAVHHIIESDLIGKPSFKTFKLPKDTVYVIGHNVGYDINQIKKCGIDISTIKPICTLALSRMVYPDASAHNLSAMSYLISKDHEATRSMLKNAHNAKTDILLTADILRDIISKKNIQTMDQLYQLSNEAMIPTHIRFGKHNGTAIAEIPSDYVHWLQKQSDLDPYLRKALALHHGER